MKVLLIAPIIVLALSSCIVTGELGDTSSSGSSATADTTAPANATSMGWTESSPHDSTTINASWTLSSSLDLKSQTISLYATATCSGTAIATDSTLDHTTSTKTFTASTTAPAIADGGSYAYTIRSFDEDGNNALSGCSSSMTISESFVASAVPEGWVGISTSYHNTTTASAEWIPSTAADLDTQYLQLYSTASCTGGSEVGGPQALAKAVTTYEWTTLIDGTTYSYSILSEDGDGNDSSANPDTCSSAVTIDTSAPTDLGGHTWSFLAGTTTATANWTEPADVDLSYTQLELHIDGTCTSTVAGKGYSDNGNFAVGTSALQFAGLTDGQTYSYQLKFFDTAGNSTVSACSTSQLIDATIPAAPTALSWSTSSPYNAAGSSVASWTASASGDVATQEIQYWIDISGGSCTCGGTNDTVSNGGWTATALPTTTSDTFLTAGAGSAEGEHCFQLRVTDTATNQASSACSSSLEIDKTAPTAFLINMGATAPATIANSNTFTASWNNPGDNDLAYQVITYYDGAGCAGNSDFKIIGAAATTHNIVDTSLTNIMLAGLTSDQEVFYRVTALDQAGNSTDSDCAAITGIEYDVTAPVTATVAATAGQDWETSATATITASNYDGTDICARWTQGAEPDPGGATTSISYYTNASCSGTAVDSNATATSPDCTLSLSQSDNGTKYYFNVTTTDNVGNTSTSVCSSEMEIRLSQLRITDTPAVATSTFGTSVASYGTIAVIGAPNDGTEGAVTIFEKDGGAWSETGTIRGATDCGAGAGANFGEAVAVDVNTIAIGMPDEGAGYVCIYEKVGSTWTYQQRISPFGSGTAAGDRFGASVAISGIYTIVGSPAYSTNSGAAYVFEHNGTSWTNKSQLTTECITDAATSQFGYSVAVSSIYAAIGAPDCSDGGTDSGAVYFYEYDGLDWNFDQGVDGGAADDNFGTSVDLFATAAIIGAPATGASDPYADVYTLGASWTLESTLTATVADTNNSFGTSVAVYGGYAVVGAPDDSNNVTGAMYIFQDAGATWDRAGVKVSNDLGANQDFGASVDLFSDTALIGAPNDTAATGAAYLQLIY